jgi:hypothetical protein
VIRRRTPWLTTTFRLRINAPAAAQTILQNGFIAFAATAPRGRDVAERVRAGILYPSPELQKQKSLIFRILFYRNSLTMEEKYDIIYLFGHFFEG